MCVDGIRRDELVMGLIRVIRWCFSLFELPTTLWGCYLGNICFKAGETSKATKCIWVSQLPSVLNQWCCAIFFRISPPTLCFCSREWNSMLPVCHWKQEEGKESFLVSWEAQCNFPVLQMTLCRSLGLKTCGSTGTCLHGGTCRTGALDYTSLPSACFHHLLCLHLMPLFG